MKSGIYISSIAANVSAKHDISHEIYAKLESNISNTNSLDIKILTWMIGKERHEAVGMLEFWCLTYCCGVCSVFFSDMSNG